MSALSKFKHDPVQFKRQFLGALSILAFLGMAIRADLALVGRDAVSLLRGAQWDESGRIFILFTPGATQSTSASEKPFPAFVAAALVAGVISAVLIRWFPLLAVLSGILGVSLRMIPNSLLFGILYLVLVILRHRGVAPIHQLIRLMREMLPQYRVSQRHVHIEEALEEVALVPAAPVGSINE